MTRKALARRPTQLARAFSRDRSGNMTILFAATAPLIIGLGALGTEGGALYWKKTAAQGVADSAAQSAAFASVSGKTALTTEARAIAAQHGFVHGVDDVSVEVHNPPQQGANTTNAAAIEVVITTKQRPMLSKVVHSADYVITSRAVAALTVGAPGCMLALDGGGDPGISIGGNANIDIPSCGVFSNSSVTPAIAAKGSGKMTASVVSAVGTIEGAGIVATTKKPNAAPVANPYASLAMPSLSEACASQPGNKATSLSPGRYCGGLQLTGNSTLDLAPGVYIIDGGELKVTSATLRGTGVTFVLTSTATMNIAGNAKIDVTAPTTGTFAGVVVFIDPATPAGTEQKFNGTSDMYFGGAIVAPTSAISFKGNGSAAAGPSCTQFVAAKLAFTGNAGIRTDCASFGVKAIGSAGQSVGLLE